MTFLDTVSPVMSLNDKADFINAISDAANVISQETGLSRELMIAQAAQESGWGLSAYSGQQAYTYNIFNIKADSSWHGPSIDVVTHEYVNGQRVEVVDKFRVYGSFEEAFRDRVAFLQQNPRYSDVFKNGVLGDFHAEAEALKKAGYATDPKYVEHLEGVLGGKTMREILRHLKGSGAAAPGFGPFTNPSDWIGGGVGDLNNKNGIPDILESIKNKMGVAGTIPSPIILDLDGDGVETTKVGSGAYFDHDANGFAESTGWVGKDDGLLVRDLNGNGKIDSGRELFGSETLLANGNKAANGFAALAELDSNQDGKINSSDSAFNALKIWKDADGDGYTSAGELLTLAQVGVQSINLAYNTSSQVDGNGNQHQQVGSYTTTTGAVRTATDVWFNTNKIDAMTENWVVVSAEVEAIRDIQMHSFEAATNDTSYIKNAGYGDFDNTSMRRVA